MQGDNVRAKAADSWDAIVIGSGMGGLSFASLYAQLARKRVLLLERHYVAGGFTHSFERKGFRWDVGLHYVGSMGPGAPARQLMDLVCGGRVGWRALPDGYDVYHYPGLRVTAYSDAARYESALCDQFPDESAAIQRYFRDIKETAQSMGAQIWSWSLPEVIAAPLRWWGWRAARLSTTTVAEYVTRNFRDSRLIAALASSWGDYGLVPEQASFATHAMITASYFGGAFFPEGGAGRIAEAAVVLVRQHGGECLLNQNVERILVEGGTAVGVKVGKRVFRAPLIVSNAGMQGTAKLLHGEEDSERTTPEISAVTLYLGLRESPEKLGVRGENHWVHEGFTHQVSDRISSVFVSFSSLNHGHASAAAGHKHTAQIMAITDPALFEKWRDTRWRQRGEDYEAFKGELAERLLELAEIATPGLRELTEYNELSTPLSVRHFTGSARIYGTAGTPQRFRERKATVRTGVRNLLMTGADVCCLGIQGALMGGAFTAGYAMNRLTGFPGVMRAAAGRQEGK